MSPTSSGSFEVERYIGACLITRQNQGRYKKNFFGDQHHQNHQKFFGYNANSSNNGNVDRIDSWAAGGMPLFSYQQRWRRDNYNPLSRLAEHTQGAPLILSNRYNNKKKFGTNNNNNNRGGNNTREKFFDGNSAAPDSVSVTSDESSGSNNSEMCLPRIIKPRKRRKKDRKPPPHLLRPIVQDNSYSTDSASPDIDVDSPPIISFVPYFSYLNHRKSEPPEAYADPTPNLQHSFEDLEDFDLNGNQTEGTCQCRYCDPTGQIWDIDRSCYSPYLTTPTKPTTTSTLLDCLSSLSLDDCKRPTTNSPDLQVSTEIVTSLNGHRDLEIRFFSQNNNNRTKEISNLCVKN
ncbi:hypothetical protein MML48_7g00002076 [Holotrichia oblita]|uniref:Uncharacterized protein n=1 Tax=Holotrichia oblita TaxID=644536 RepID=A0ACB9SPZ0_HOLOL|nr:hypothetical protein MML48_7g00002076 [Holotrichia oblita]